MSNSNNFLAELKRRNVYRVAIAYVIASWIILQVLELIVSLAGAPDWIGKLFLGLLLLGLPIVLILSWVYELTPEGIKREKEVDRSQSITPQTGSRLDKTIIGIFVIAVAWIVIDRTMLKSPTPPPPMPVQQDEVVATEVIDKSIAVLPFMNMSEDTNAGHFSDGLADTVLHKLAQIDSLRVVARNSSFQFRGQNVDIRDVGEQLNVANILEGSVQASGNKIRVTAQLIQAETGYHLWSGNFDRELDDVFAIQDEIAGEVVNALQVSLGDEDSARLTRRDTDNVDAFREYSLALRQIDEFTFDSLDRAMAHLDKATEIDPGYALAWATKGLVLRLGTTLGSKSETEYIAKGREVANHALELDPQLPLAMAIIADTHSEENNFDIALPLVEKAVELAPNDPMVLGVYSSVLSDELRPSESADIKLRAIELDPLSIPAHQSAAQLLGALGRDEEAFALIERMRVINPQAAVASWVKSYYYADRGEWAQAIMEMIEAARLDASDPIGPADVAWYMVALGLKEEALAWSEKSQEVNPAHAAAVNSLFIPWTGNEILDQDVVRLARRVFIENIAPEKGNARAMAGDFLELAAVQSGYFDEYLAWARHFAPHLFDPSIEDLEGSLGTAVSSGFLLIEKGELEQGQRLVDLGSAEMKARRVAYRQNPIYWDFWVAARAGDRETAISVLNNDMDRQDSTEIRIDSLIWHHAPWIRPYHLEPAYQAMMANFEQLAAEQRELLLELNGGTYPMPE